MRRNNILIIAHCVELVFLGRLMLLWFKINNSWQILKILFCTVISILQVTNNTFIENICFECNSIEYSLHLANPRFYDTWLKIFERIWISSIFILILLLLLLQSWITGVESGHVIGAAVVNCFKLLVKLFLIWWLPASESHRVRLW